MILLAMFEWRTQILPEHKGSRYASGSRAFSSARTSMATSSPLRPARPGSQKPIYDDDSDEYRYEVKSLLYSPTLPRRVPRHFSRSSTNCQGLLCLVLQPVRTASLGRSRQELPEYTSRITPPSTLLLPRLSRHPLRQVLKPIVFHRHSIRRRSCEHSSQIC